MCCEESPHMCCARRGLGQHICGDSRPRTIYMSRIICGVPDHMWCPIHVVVHVLWMSSCGASISWGASHLMYVVLHVFWICACVWVCICVVNMTLAIDAPHIHNTGQHICGHAYVTYIVLNVLYEYDTGDRPYALSWIWLMHLALHMATGHMRCRQAICVVRIWRQRIWPHMACHIHMRTTHMACCPHMGTTHMACRLNMIATLWRQAICVVRIWIWLRPYALWIWLMHLQTIDAPVSYSRHKYTLTHMTTNMTQATDAPVSYSQHKHTLTHMTTNMTQVAHWCATTHVGYDTGD